MHTQNVLSESGRPIRSSRSDLETHAANVPCNLNIVQGGFSTRTRELTGLSNVSASLRLARCGRRTKPWYMNVALNTLFIGTSARTRNLCCEEVTSRGVSPSGKALGTNLMLLWGPDCCNPRKRLQPCLASESTREPFPGVNI